MLNDHILHAYEITDQGQGIPIPNDDLTKAINSEVLTWVHLDGTKSESRAWLAKQGHIIDDLTIDALLETETRPRIIEFESSVLVILRGVNLNKDARTEDMVSIRLWADQSRIFSVRNRQLKAVKDMEQRLLKSKGPTSSADLLCQLIGRLFDRMEPVFSELNDRLDDTEERVLDSPDGTDRQAITLIRKQAIAYRRYMAPQRDVIASLRASDIPWLEKAHQRQLQESHNQLIRYLEDIDTIRERAQIVKDELANILADKMNKNMYLLSIVAAVFLPLGFFTGLLGINVGGMPGAESDIAFWLVCLICIVFGVSVIGLFKYLKWL